MDCSMLNVPSVFFSDHHSGPGSPLTTYLGIRCCVYTQNAHFAVLKTINCFAETLHMFVQVRRVKAEPSPNSHTRR